MLAEHATPSCTPSQAEAKSCTSAVASAFTGRSAVALCRRRASFDQRLTAIPKIEQVLQTIMNSTAEVSLFTPNILNAE
jgi:hypothetical protein